MRLELRDLDLRVLDFLAPPEGATFAVGQKGVGEEGEAVSGATVAGLQNFPHALAARFAAGISVPGGCKAAAAAAFGRADILYSILVFFSQNIETSRSRY